MDCSNLCELRVSSPGVQAALRGGQGAAALRAAAEAAARGLSDLGTAQIAVGQSAAGLQSLKMALGFDAACQSAFHNLTAALLTGGSLRNQNLADVWSHLLRNWTALPWASAYRHLFYMPRFLNIEFVRGKCNLKCRMCIGVNGAGHPNKLTYLEPADFERMLVHAPTIGGVTLSSGDSDPLLHPAIDEIIAIAKKHRAILDLYTNGLPLSARTARAIVETGAVGTINFSIDAATPETYQTIRGGDFGKLIPKIRMLQEMKREREAKRPRVSVSFVAMADTVHELPAFVRLAADLGVDQVIVNDLSGWLGESHGNEPAANNPNAAAILREAARTAEALKVPLQLHEGLRQILAGANEAAAAAVAIGDEAQAAPKTVSLPILAAHLHAVNASASGAAGDGTLACCGWIDGIWVNNDGRLQPCCMVRNAADMGSIFDGPLHQNEKYLKVKDLLLTGKVFRACADQRMCRYIQEQSAANRPLRVITDAELGALAPPRAASPCAEDETMAAFDGDASADSSFALPVLQATA